METGRDIQISLWNSEVNTISNKSKSVQFKGPRASEVDSPPPPLHPTYTPLHLTPTHKKGDPL